MPRQVVVITGAGAGVGRSAAREFAKQGFDVGLLGRNGQRLEEAAGEVRAYGVEAAVAIADVADGGAVEEAADRLEAALGPIAVWVNNAAAGVFAPVSELSTAEFRRATEVTYLGTVHGTMAALRRMRRRGQGGIVNVSSALAYRSVPLQSAMSGAKAAVRAFTDSLRSEIIHDGDDIRLATIYLPSLNTPHHSWVLNRTGKRVRPIPPVYEPEIAARAIVYAATHRRREVWLGPSTIRAILADRLAAALADGRLARTGYSAQLEHQAADPRTPHNLYESVPGPHAAHGRFNGGSRKAGLVLTSSHKPVLLASTLPVAALALLRRGLRGR